MSETRSVFLYGKPTVLKMNLLKNTQREYTLLINKFINIMGQDPTYLLDLLTNNKQSPKVRSLEKEVCKSHRTWLSLWTKCSGYGSERTT